MISHDDQTVLRTICPYLISQTKSRNGCEISINTIVFILSLNTKKYKQTL